MISCRFITVTKTFLQLSAVVLFLWATGSPAQIFNRLHNFPATSHDGYSPLTDLVLNGNTLYGTTASGGTNFNGIIFKINTDGTGYRILKSFTDGGPEQGGMVLVGNNLYGTTFTGGSGGNGTVFEIDTNGGNFVVMHNFSATVPSVWGTNYDGNRPEGDLVTDGNALYGTTQYGGTNGNGTIFKITLDGTFSVIKTFSPTFIGTRNVSGNPLVTSGTNSDGAYPTCGLVLDGATLYGTTYKGGLSNGVVFAVQTDGSAYNVLKYFPGVTGLGTNRDGAAPVAGLALNGGTLYGVTVGGGAGAVGNVFKLQTNGSAFTDLHDFSNADGTFPRNTLLLDGSTLYGTTAAGGLSNNGTIFMVQTDGADFTILKQLNMSIGMQSDSKLVLSSNTLYGTAADGGSIGGGVVFGLTVPPQILGDNHFGMRSNMFGFDFTGISNQTAIIESCPDLTQPVWSPLQTNSLTGSPQYFFDADFRQNAGSFYRIFSP